MPYDRLPYKNRGLILVSACIVATCIYLHTHILYWFLGPEAVLFQALLRFTISVVPILATWAICRLYTKTAWFYLVCLLWFFFIPYPLYNFFQIRHIAEIFHLPAGVAFTSSQAITQLWKMLPVAVYSFFQLVTFFYCHYQVQRLFPTRFKRRIFTLSVFGYASLATVIGLLTRLDTCHMLTKPDLILAQMASFVISGQLLNVLAVFSFALVLFWVYASGVSALGERNNFIHRKI